MNSPTFEMVREFHKTFGHLAPERPTKPSEKLLRDRYGFVESELKELLEALDNGDLLQAIDAWGDIMYFIEGNFVSAGISSLDVFTEIHRSNMSKLWPASEPDLNARRLSVLGLSAEDVEFKPVVVKGVEWLVCTLKSNGKVQKGPYYREPDLSRFLPEQVEA